MSSLNAAGSLKYCQVEVSAQFVKCMSVFVKQWQNCENRLISHLCMLGL